MEYRILGAFEVSDNGRRVELGGRKQRALLAILLLHANEVVSLDRLIDELWGEKPPPTAAKTLQAHVSRLRKALNGNGEAAPPAGGRLETRGPGYLLRVGSGELDAERFQSRLAEARRALARGETRAAAESVHAALALWRGPALADFTYEPFAATEIARLDELRLTALEERVEVDLALGRHHELVSELEALVAHHPLRERLAGQLMLALYRSDRQAEALDVYQHARLALTEELGIEPSQRLQRLERQILEHAPALMDGARPERRPTAPTVGARRRTVAVVAATLMLVAVASAALLLARDQDDGPVATGSAGLHDPETGELLASVPVGGAPSNVAVGEGGVWVLDADDKTVSRIDASDRTVVRIFSTASTPTDLAVGAGAVWVANGFREAGLHGTFLPESVSRIDPETNDVVATIPLHRADTGPYQQGDAIAQQHIAVTDAAVWAINPDLSVSRIDPRTNRVVARVTGVEALTIAAGGGGVWIVDGGTAVAKIDTAANRVATRIEVPTDSLTALAVGAGAVWVANTLGGSVWRVDYSPEPILHEIPLALGVSDIAVGEESIWATNEIAGRIYRIDPQTNRAQVVSRIAAPRGVAFGTRAAWVTSGGAPSPHAALPASACGELVFGGAGSPRLLLVSNLPLEGPWNPATRSMVEAIRFVLERRGFKAGRYTVGYQSCDESTAQAHGFEFNRCYSNAKAFARKPNVIGVIGAHSSFCSYYQIPIVNQAPGGPLAMISPSNTFTGLTRPHRGMRRGELAALYPSGARNYVRIAAADHLQAVASAELARQLGSKRLFVLSYGADPYLAGWADNVRRAARNFGIEIAGSRPWNPDARDFAGLVRRIARAGADSVFIGGHLLPNGGALVRDLRRHLGRKVDLIATDYFFTIPDLIKAAGPAAKGVYVSVFGLPNGELPPRGQRFLADFETQPRGARIPHFAAAYAAQATEILLDSIARSDGTRTSVTRELRRTRVEDGILGDIRFDENGDLLEGPFTILRVADRPSRNSLILPQFNGAGVDRVITARPGSLR